MVNGPGHMLLPSDRKVVVLVSAPFRVDTVVGVHQNIERAKELADALWKAGFVAVCPHSNTGHMFGQIDEDAVIEGYLELVSRVDMVVAVEEWGGSSGVKAELERATALGIPIWLLPTRESMEQEAPEVLRSLRKFQILRMTGFPLQAEAINRLPDFDPDDEKPNITGRDLLRAAGYEEVAGGGEAPKSPGEACEECSEKDSCYAWQEWQQAQRGVSRGVRGN